MNEVINERKGGEQKILKSLSSFRTTSSLARRNGKVTEIFLAARPISTAFQSHDLTLILLTWRIG